MAMTGIVSTTVSLASTTLSATGLCAVLDLAYTLSLSEFIHTFHETILKDNSLYMVKYTVGIAAMALFPMQSVFAKTILVIHTIYIAVQIHGTYVILNYLFFLVVFSRVDTLRIFMHVCIFALTSLAYEMIELEKEIEKAKTMTYPCFYAK